PSASGPRSENDSVPSVSSCKKPLVACELQLRDYFPRKSEIQWSAKEVMTLCRNFFRRSLGSICRIALAVLVFFFLLWCFGMRMPGKNIATAAPLSAAEVALRAELVADVQALAGDIGERNMSRYPQ